MSCLLQTFAVLYGFDDLFLLCWLMCSFIFLPIAFQISEYSMLSFGVPFFSIFLSFPLSCLIPVTSLSGLSLMYLLAIEMVASWIIFAVDSPLEWRSYGGSDASAANPFWKNLIYNYLLLWCNLPVSTSFGWTTSCVRSNLSPILVFPLIRR